MRIELPSLQELVSQENPEAVDLNCYEIMSSDEEEVDEELPLYSVAVHCGSCRRRVRLFCAASREALHLLECLLFEDLLAFLCPGCALAGEDGG
ncbi:E7 [Eidolon helvum papillomavirus 1]|uniref:Protein E7 n=1 Tax=Eidolon helvum papillomavirus 1 TaxID=1163701 RepID=S4TH86_9PAPI|nr:E7 [Eidolon helvum papillomavirus 1]AGB34176.1 E7 [Eidolon helvum papillomavirus 1]